MGNTPGSTNTSVQRGCNRLTKTELLFFLRVAVYQADLIGARRSNSNL